MPKRDATQNVQLKVRMKEPLRFALESAATEKGISLNAEVVSRLERSFEYERHISDLFGDQRTYAVVRMIATVMDVMQKSHPKKSDASDWLDDPASFDAMLAAVIRTLEIFRPTTDHDPNLWNAAIVAVNAETMLRETLEKLPVRVKQALERLGSRLEDELQILRERRLQREQDHEEHLRRAQAERNGGSS